MKTKINRIMSMIIALAMVVTLMGGIADVKSASAAESAKVYVTVSDGNGKQVVRQQAVDVKDVDGDKALTINDALYCAHEKYYKNGGAEAGYASSAKEGYTGLSIDKLWGIENGGSYGYYVNNTMAMSLSDPVKTGDYIDAFVYSDTTDFSDKYTFFSKRVIEVNRNKKVSFKLSYLGFDENWNTLELPLAKAAIIDGSNQTEYKTNKKGTVKISFDKVGSHLITAAAPKDSTIVPPACIVYVLPNKGNRIKKDGIEYTIIKVGSVLKNKKGKVTYKAADLEEGQKAPKTVEIGGVTYKVKKSK